MYFDSRINYFCSCHLKSNNLDTSPNMSTTNFSIKNTAPSEVDITIVG